MKVAITGISGYIGTVLLSRLAEEKDVETVVGVDIRSPRLNLPKLKFYSQDTLQPLGGIFAENEIDSAIHLAFVLKPTRDRTRTRQVDIGGSETFLDACRQAGVKHILYLSSHTVYGAHPDNPPLITEDVTMRPLKDFQYSWDKTATEQILQDFTAANKDICLTVLRSCPVIGPNAANSVAAIMFKPAVMIGIKGYDPPMQFVHEDDIARLVMILLRQKRPGIFNVAGNRSVLYSELAKLAGKRMLCLPGWLLGLLMHITWALRLQSESPVSGLEFIKYPEVVSTEKLRRETGFEFIYSSKDAVTSFVSTTRIKRR